MGYNFRIFPFLVKADHIYIQLYLFFPNHRHQPWSKDGTIHTSQMNFSYCIAPVPIAPINHQIRHRRHIFPMPPHPKIHRCQANAIFMIFHLPMTPVYTSLVNLNKNWHKHKCRLSHQPPLHHINAFLCHLPQMICMLWITGYQFNGHVHLPHQNCWNCWKTQSICLRISIPKCSSQK